MGLARTVNRLCEPTEQLSRECRQRQIQGEKCVRSWLSSILSSKDQKIASTSLTRRWDSYLLPFMNVECVSRALAAVVRGDRRWRWSRIRRNLFRSRTLSKPLSSRLLPANTHQVVQKKGSSPRPRAKARAREKKRDPSILCGLRPPPQHWPSRGSLD